jgi:hypothetical protein
MSIQNKDKNNIVGQCAKSQSDCERNDWYCHNFCNYSKFDKWNNEIFARNFPTRKQPLVLDLRPDIKPCVGITYKKQEAGPMTAEPYELELDLKPKRSDKDCFFCHIINYGCLAPNKPNYLQYLKIIDIDSYVKGMAYPLSKCDIFKKNPLVCGEKALCMNCRHKIQENPQLVKILNRWNIQPTRGGLMKNVDAVENKSEYFCDNGKRVVPVENLWNNNTKAVYTKYDIQTNAPIRKTY